MTRPAAVPFVRPSFGPAEARALRDSFRSGWLGSGLYARLFERRVARAVGRPYAAAVGSGTAALRLALRLLDLEGGEVLTTPLSVPSTGHAILHSGAVPVFCDVDPGTGNPDPRALEAGLTRRTKAILVVHLNGHACDMDPILGLARSRGLPVVEDACAALPVEGSYKGRPLGSMGELGCFSFSGLKNLSCMDGGAVVHSRPEWAGRLSRLRSLGQRLGPGGPVLRPDALVESGFHDRMSDVSAVLGLTQLERWGGFASRLRAVARLYAEGVEGLPGLEPPREEPYARRSLLYYPIRVSGGRKRELRASLLGRGVETGDFLFPLHLYRLYRPFRRPLPAAERLARELVYLPFHPTLTDAEAGRVVDALRRFAAWAPGRPGRAPRRRPPPGPRRRPGS